jgi:hypothetical protein
MEKTMLVKMTLKESRGEGDTVTILIEGKDKIVTEDKYIKITDTIGNFYIFSVHNVLYMKIFKDAPMEEKINEKFIGTDGGVLFV